MSKRSRRVPIYIIVKNKRSLVERLQADEIGRLLQAPTECLKYGERLVAVSNGVARSLAKNPPLVPADNTDYYAVRSRKAVRLSLAA